MAGIWAGYRYSLLGFLLLDTLFVLIISAQNIQTGRLVGGGEKSNIYTLIVSIFSAIFLGLVLWFDLIKRQSVLAQVRWELIWMAAIILFTIIGFASIASNKPAADTCNGGQDSAWNICAASKGMLALLALAIIALIGHASALVVMIIKLSRRTELSVWEFMAWDLPNALAPPPVITTTNIPLSRPGMVDVNSGRPVSKALPDIPQPEPSPMSWRRRDPFTFSSVSSLLNPAPRDPNFDPRAENRYQLYDAPVPIPVERPPVPRAFERISGYLHDGNTPQQGGPSFSLYYAPTPVYDRFARGGSDASPIASSAGVPASPGLPPPAPLKIQKRDGKWALADEMGAMDRRPIGDAQTLPARLASVPQAHVQVPAAAQTMPVRRPTLTRTPPRISPGSLPNPNTHRPSRT